MSGAMTTWSRVRSRSKQVLLWLAARWHWVLGGLGAIAALVLVASRRRTQPEVPSQGELRRDVDASAEKELESARVKAEDEKKEIRIEYVDELEEAARKRDEKYEEVKDDPEALQDWLLDLGRSQRKK
jgi:hypothetical protein